jgi:hypothetical protein
MHERVIRCFFFLELTMAEVSYLAMLELSVLPQLPPGTVYRKDGAPPHYSSVMKDHFNHMMPGRWIGGGMSIAWPPRSSSLTLLGMFPWDYVKNLIYQVKNNNLQQLKACIRDLVAMATHNVLQNTWTEVKYHLDIFCATWCAHIEI